MVKLLAWVGLVLAAVFFLTTGGTYPGIASVQAHVIGQVLAIAILGGWLLIALVKPAWRSSTPLLVPVALASLAYALSALASQRPRLSFEPTIAGLGWALAFLFLGRLLAEPWFRARVGVVMTAFVAVVSVGYLGQVLAEWITWWGLVGRLAVPPLRPSFAGLFLGSPNLIGTALVLLAPLVVSIAWSAGGRRRWLGVALGVASALAIFVSGSRGAWLGVGVGVLVGLALYVTRPGYPRERVSLRGWSARAKAHRRWVLPIGLAAVGAALFAPSLIRRLEQGGATLRFDLWQSALTIFAEYPLLGAGPGTWVQLKVAANPDGVPNLILPHAHQLYVQAAAELGVVGLLAGAVLVVAVVLRLWAGWRSIEPAAERPTGRASTTPSTGRLSIEAGAVIVSLAAFAGQSIVDNLVNLPFVCLIVVTLVAWVDAGLPHSDDGRAAPAGIARLVGGFQRGPLLPVLGLAAFALVIPTLLRIDRAASIAQAGNDAALRGHWQLALDQFNAARAEDPGFTLYEIQAASAFARVGRTAEARDLFAQAAASDPTAINLIGLAALEAEIGDGHRALEIAQQAVRLGIRESDVALNAGLIAERLGDTQMAVDQFANAVAWNIPLARSGFWTGAASRRRRDGGRAGRSDAMGPH